MNKKYFACLDITENHTSFDRVFLYANVTNDPQCEFYIRSIEFPSRFQKIVYSFETVLITQRVWKCIQTKYPKSWLHIGLHISTAMSINFRYSSVWNKQMTSFLIIIIEIHTHSYKCAGTQTHIDVIYCVLSTFITFTLSLYVYFHCNHRSTVKCYWCLCHSLVVFLCGDFFSHSFMCIWLAPLMFIDSISKCLSNTCFFFHSLVVYFLLIQVYLFLAFFNRHFMPKMVCL